MARMALTDISIRALKPTGKQQAYWCTLVPNFGLLLSQAGGKSFFVMVGRERRRLHLVGVELVDRLGEGGHHRLRRLRVRLAELLGDEQHHVPEVRPSRRAQGDRAGEVRVDAEVDADLAQDVIDQDRAVGGVELGRSPPVIALQRVVTQVDEPAFAASGVEQGDVWAIVPIAVSAHATVSGGFPVPVPWRSVSSAAIRDASTRSIVS